MMKSIRIAQSVTRKYQSVLCRSISFESVVSKTAANQFIKSMEENSQFIDTPTICVTDPSTARLWEWSSGLERFPKLSSSEIESLAKSGTDPFQLVEADLSAISKGMIELLGDDHPDLDECAKYFFSIDSGKKIRPAMVLAVSYALGAHKRAITNHDQINISNISNIQNKEKTSEEVASPSQKRLSQIIELIHTASLFHDDVIDKATTRRNVPSVNQVFGNKFAILGGDFLLSRASVASARLRNMEVVELLSTIIEHLVKGEVMQMRTSSTSKVAMLTYLKKNFYKTASLMGHACLSAAVLEGHSEECQRACYLYGTYIGQAFQLIDDCLDFEGTTSTLGKTPLADLKSGLATAPTLFAFEEYPQLGALISRKFETPGDVDEALGLVTRSRGLQRSRDLAQVHVEMAIEAIEHLSPSRSRDALVALACKVVHRKT